MFTNLVYSVYGMFNNSNVNTGIKKARFKYSLFSAEYFKRLEKLQIYSKMCIPKLFLEHLIKLRSTCSPIWNLFLKWGSRIGHLKLEASWAMYINWPPLTWDHHIPLSYGHRQASNLKLSKLHWLCHWAAQSFKVLWTKNRAKVKCYINCDHKFVIDNLTSSAR